MNKFKVGDKVKRTDMDFTYVEPSVAKRFGAGEVFTVLDISSCTGSMKLSEIPNSWSQKRFSLAEDTSNYYKHYDLVIAWMQGREVQYQRDDGKWSTLHTSDKSLVVPPFHKPSEYRIKPEPCPKEDKLTSLVSKLEEQLKEAQEQLKEMRNE